MKPAFSIALLYIDLAVSASPSFYGFKNDWTRTTGKHEAWPTKGVQKDKRSNRIYPTDAAIHNSIYNEVEPPFDFHHTNNLPEITQRPEDLSKETIHLPMDFQDERNKSRSEGNYGMQQTFMMPAATHNKPAAFWQQEHEDFRKVGTFTNIINTKIATPRLAHLLPLWIPQRKYFNVRRDENIFLRNQRSNNLHRDWQLSANLQNINLHGLKDYFGGDNYNIDDKVLSHWNRFSIGNTIVVQKENEKTKRQISMGPPQQTSPAGPKRFFLSKKDFRKKGKFHIESEIPYVLYRLHLDDKTAKSNNLLNYLNHPSTAIYGPYLGMLRSDLKKFAVKKKMRNIMDCFRR